MKNSRNFKYPTTHAACVDFGKVERQVASPTSKACAGAPVRWADRGLAEAVAANAAVDMALLPDCWAPREWRQLRRCIRDPQATVVDHQEAFPGICCVSAPVWGPDGKCTAAVTALVHSAKIPPGLPSLVWRTARAVDAALR